MKEGGLTLLEIIISVSILVLITTIVSSVFLSVDRHQALERDVAKVKSTLERARELTLFSKNSSQYGVYFATTTVTLFKGIIYQAENSENYPVKLHSKVFISSYNLSGGGDSVVFERLTGETNQSGTIVLRSKIDSTASSTISIEETGLIK